MLLPCQLGPSRLPLPKAPEAPPCVVVAHDWEQQPYGHRCRRCHRLAMSGAAKTRHDAAGCEGHPAARKLILEDLDVHVRVRGHDMWSIGQYVWCKRCAHLTKHLVVGLGSRCPAAVQAGGPRSRWRNLMAGRSPYAAVKDSPIGVPRRLTLEAWLGLRGLLRDPALEASDVLATLNAEVVEATPAEDDAASSV